MEDPSVVVRRLINELRDDMSEAGRELRNRSVWDLQCPVVIIDARSTPNRVVRTSVRGVTGAIATSNVIDDPLMRSFLERFREVGADEALDEFLRDLTETSSPNSGRFTTTKPNNKAWRSGHTVMLPNLCSSQKPALTMVSWPALPSPPLKVVMPTTF